jgi:hypothetical protein
MANSSKLPGPETTIQLPGAVWQQNSRLAAISAVALRLVSPARSGDTWRSVPSFPSACRSEALRRCPAVFGQSGCLQAPVEYVGRVGGRGPCRGRGHDQSSGQVWTWSAGWALCGQLSPIAAFTRSRSDRERRTGQQPWRDLAGRSTCTSSDTVEGPPYGATTTSCPGCRSTSAGALRRRHQHPGPVPLCTVPGHLCQPSREGRPAPSIGNGEDPRVPRARRGPTVFAMRPFVAAGGDAGRPPSRQPAHGVSVRKRDLIGE